jgi:hypothetical protein
LLRQAGRGLDSQTRETERFYTVFIDGPVHSESVDAALICIAPRDFCGVIEMTKKPRIGNAAKESLVVHPSMMGDGTEEQTLSERGHPSSQIEKKRKSLEPSANRARTNSVDLSLAIPAFIATVTSWVILAFSVPASGAALITSQSPSLVLS